MTSIVNFIQLPITITCNPSSLKKFQINELELLRKKIIIKKWVSFIQAKKITERIYPASHFIIDSFSLFFPKKVPKIFLWENFILFSLVHCKQRRTMKGKEKENFEFHPFIWNIIILLVRLYIGKLGLPIDSRNFSVSNVFKTFFSVNY